MTPTWRPDTVSDELLALTRTLGDPALDLAIVGEGNTSEALDERTIVVKASGARLRDATAESFVTVDAPELVALIEDPATTQADLTHALDGGVQGGARRRGSIETLIHASVRAFAAVRFVAHTHPTAVVSLLSSVRSETAFAAAAYSDEAVIIGEPLWVPYAPPGIELGRVFHRRLRERVERTGSIPSLVLLGNHGIVVCSETCEGAEAVTLMTVKGATVRLGAYMAGGFVGIDQKHVAEYFSREDFAERRDRLSGTSA